MRVTYKNLDITPLGPGLAYTLLFSIYIIVFQPGLTQVIIAVMIANTILYFLGGRKQTIKVFLLSQVVTILTILFIYYAYYFFGSLGLIAVVVISYLIALLIFWQRWSKIKPLLQWWEKTYTGMTAEERQKKNHKGKKRVV